jgi:hypothetical protein
VSLRIRYNELVVRGRALWLCATSHLRRRDGRVAEGARLESVYTLTGIVGSNPTLSASNLPSHDSSLLS